jgi:hypothetical protein
MYQTLKFYSFLPFLMSFIIFSAQQATGQDCNGLSSTYKETVVSLKVEKETIETGAIVKEWGTGFVISPRGYVLTANHLLTVSDPAKVRIVSIKGSLGALDGEYLDLVFEEGIEKWDIALLKFKNNKTYLTVPLGNPHGVDEDQRLCSLSFSAPLKLDYHLSDGVFSNRQDGFWFTQMPSNMGESGAPVFSSITKRVVAMKYGTITGPVQVNGVFKLTPLNFAKNMVEEHTGITMTDDVPKPVTIKSIDITYITGSNAKEASVEVKTSLQLNGQEIGRIADGVGFNERWKKGRSFTREITLKEPIPYDQCGGLRVIVNKTGMYQWDVSFRVVGKLSDGKTIQLLNTTQTYKLGDGDNYDPAVESLSCAK